MASSGVIPRRASGAGLANIGQERPTSAPLASLMTKEAVPGNITTARVAADHLDLFRQKQAVVRNMEVKAVAIEDCVVLAAFEIYAAVQLQTPV